MSHSSSASAPLRGVRIWLIIVAAMIFAMVLVGGATRLTESGLSIVEWKPVTGTLPPLTTEQWTAAFDGYKAIPQYRELNQGMTLDQFKTIFWWEWSHRLLGRTIGMVFLLPFLWFLWRGGLSRDLKQRLWLIFALGGLQGAVGWWMVASGLSERTEVSHYRLATHLMLAVTIFAAIVWTLRRLRPRAAGTITPPPRLRITATLITVVVFVQLYLGALVAGLRAGRIYNTWPLIDGSFIPAADRLWFDHPWWRNLFDNRLTVQFEHRMVAYTLLALVLWHAFDAIRSRAGATVTSGACWLAATVAAQAVLGILTLINMVPIDIALTHQAVAMVVLTLAVVQVERLTPSASVSAPAPALESAGRAG
jgi:cytochrome c oxidase assembly protein subunit 15